MRGAVGEADPLCWWRAGYGAWCGCRRRRGKICQLHREREDLLAERTRHRNRLSSKLVARGIRLPIGRDFWARLEAVTLFDGSGLPAHLKAGLIREWERLQVVQAQLRALEPPIGALIKGADSAKQCAP